MRCDLTDEEDAALARLLLLFPLLAVILVISAVKVWRYLSHPRMCSEAVA
jgi:hypothetical protein